MRTMVSSLLLLLWWPCLAGCVKLAGSTTAVGDLNSGIDSTSLLASHRHQRRQIGPIISTSPALQPCGDPFAGPVLGGLDLVTAATTSGTAPAGSARLARLVLLKQTACCLGLAVLWAELNFRRHQSGQNSHKAAIQSTCKHTAAWLYYGMTAKLLVNTVG